MFTHYRTEGVVLSKKDIKEADTIFNIYTKEFGAVSVLGRSIRKNKSKLGMKMSLFSLLDIGFISGKNYNTLVDIETVDSFNCIKKNLAKLSFTYQLAETFSSLVVEEEKDERIYELVVESLQIINKGFFSSNSLKLVYCLFSFRLLYFLGHKLYINNCVFCDIKINKEGYFSAEEGGVVCLYCYNKHHKEENKKKFIYLDDVGYLKSVIDADINGIFDQENNIFIKILNNYLENIPRQKILK